jgi:hypothetical protein
MDRHNTPLTRRKREIQASWMADDARRFAVKQSGRPTTIHIDGIHSSMLKKHGSQLFQCRTDGADATRARGAQKREEKVRIQWLVKIDIYFPQ